MYCDICEQRILSDGSDSYILFDSQMEKLFVDDSVSFANQMPHTSQDKFLTVCETCIMKGYVSPFGTQKTYAAKRKLSIQEIEMAKEISIANGKGEDISKYKENVDNCSKPKNKRWWQFCK